MISVDWIIFFVGASNLLISWLVYKSNPNEKLNKYFFIFGFVSSVQILFDSLFRVIPTVFVLQCSYAFACLIPITASLWIFEICEIKIKNWLKVLFFLPGLLLFAITYVPGLIVKQINGLSFLGYRGILGPFFSAYTFYFVIYVILFIIFLYKAQRNTDRVKKFQLRYTLAGIFLYAFFSTVFSLILPIVFNIYDFTLLDAPSFIFFVGFTGYAVTKHHLFDVKVIGTELLTFTIWLILLIRTFISETLNQFVFNGIIFALVVFFGMLLIRSALNDVRQKEKMEKLALDLDMAYESEKNARKQVEALDVAKDQFLLAIEHHLRTPLTAMLGYSDILLNGTAGKQPKKQKEITEKFQASTKSLIKMVNDFLDVTQFQLGKEVISLKSKVSVLPIIEEIVSDLKFEVERKKIYLNFEKNESIPEILADREKLKAALYNIIDNAVKYTNTGGVNVKLTSDEKNVHIIVKDTGIGILAQNIPTLFGKTFERGVEAKKVFTTGRGIGVYIAGQIVKAHKGNIKVESLGEGKGSTFIIELPK